MKIRKRVTGAAVVAALLVGALGVQPALADEKKGDAAACPAGLRHVITSKTSGDTRHRDETHGKTYEKGQQSNSTATTRLGLTGAYRWGIAAGGRISTGGDSCSIL